jgi:hypothetical protein
MEYSVKQALTNKRTELSIESPLVGERDGYTIMKYIVMIILSISIGLFLASQGIADVAPDEKTIKTWLHVDEECEIVKICNITLVGGEPAYIAHVLFPKRGRCCEEVSVLVRPQLKQAQEIQVISQTLKVLDLGSDGVSEIEAHGSHMGQGWVEGIWQIYSIDGWEPIILYEYGPVVLNNEGAGCGLRDHAYWNRPCELRTVSLSYEDLNHDQVADLIETVEEETFWYKPETDEDTVFASDEEREKAIDPASRSKRILRHEYLYTQHQFLERNPVQDP